MNFTDKIKLKKKVTSFKNFTIASENDELDSLRHFNNIASTWKVERSLKAKVGSDGMLKDFFGDTIILPLDAKYTNSFLDIRKEFSSLDMFAEELDPNFYHMTVHDLSNGKKTKKLEEKVLVNQEKCEAIFSNLKAFLAENPDRQKVTMRFSHVYPSANVAIVCGLLPKTKDDYNTLLNIYNLFEDVVYLYYEPRFHVTLNYFQARVFRQMEVKELYSAMKNIKADFEVEFDINKLIYQNFLNMNIYQNIISL